MQTTAENKVNESRELPLLKTFVINFADPFFKTCILIENLVCADYNPFYVDVATYIMDYFNDPQTFYGNEILSETYAKFAEVFKSRTKESAGDADIMALEDVLTRPYSSYEDCYDALQNAYALLTGY